MAKELILRSNEDVRAAIRRRQVEIAASMSDEEFFLSTSFKSYAGQLADFILRNHKLYNLTFQFDKSPQGMTACTDGKNIFVNAGTEMAQKPKLLERRFKVVMGLLFHEAAHKLFMDFTFFHATMKKLMKGSLVGKFDTQKDPVLEDCLKEIEDVASSGYASALSQVYAEISNIVDDGHDEAAMRRFYPGFITECIDTMDDVQWNLTDPLDKVIADRTPAFGILCQMLLEYVLWGSYKYDTKTPEVEKYLNIMVDLEPILDAALVTDIYKERWNLLNLLILRIWPYIRDMFPQRQPQQNLQPSQQSGQSSQQGAGGSQGGQQQQGQHPGASGAAGQQGASGSSQQQGGNGQGNAAPSAQDLQQMLQQLAQAVREQMNCAPAPVNGSGTQVDPNSIQSGGSSAGNGADASAIALSAAESSATAQVQQAIDQAQLNAIRNANTPLIHSSIPLTVIRHNTENKARYNAIAKEIAPYARTLISEMKALLRELNEEYKMRHLSFGPIIEATKSYRYDRKFFAKKKLPEDLPNMALCILLDQSGSMGGEKLEAAKKTAILMEQFASAIGIPFMVAGHDTSGSEVNLRIFTDYISTNQQKDRYSLAGIEAGGCNRDGLPIRKCCEMLASRQEDVRLMVVISDGSPNHSGYRGEEARADISKTVAEFRRKGLLIYGAAIDEDREIIQEIYGKNFLSIDNLKNLPKALVRLVRQQII